MKTEIKTTQAIFTKLKEYEEVIPLILGRFGLSDKLKHVDEINYFRSFKDTYGKDREIDGHILSKSGKIVVWFEFKLGQDFDQEQLLREYDALKKRAGRSFDYLLVGVSDHPRKPHLFTRLKHTDGLKCEWLSYEDVRKAFSRLRRFEPDTRTKRIIENFLAEFFRQPFTQFNKAQFHFISDSIESLTDMEDLGEHCIKVDQQISDFAGDLRKALGKNFKVKERPINREWGTKGFVKLSIPDSVVVDIKNTELKQVFHIRFDFRLGEYSFIEENGQSSELDLKQKNIVQSVRNQIEKTISS